MNLKNVVPSYKVNPNKRDKKIENYIEEIGKGNKEAISELYNLTKSSIYGYILSVMKNRADSEDILQEVYIKIIQNAKKYKSQGKPMQWIITITKNLCNMQFRKQKSIIDINEVYDILSDDKKMKIEDKIFIETIFKNLTDEERQILTLHLISGFKHREISKILNMPLSTILSKYNRTIKKIKKQNKKEGDF